ncbi:hypothetical protein [Catellatospora chokoriensis]|uniref:hypothetical protein n=1 Tax=Catellatospora chokoriensis TaxID=310353 RepID=UPI00177AFC04|nr:hypothetical protein [Catellatospora chokoriensis]
MFRDRCSDEEGALLATDVDAGRLGPVAGGTARVHAILWPGLLVMAGVAAVVEPSVSRLLPDPAPQQAPTIGEALTSAGGNWFLLTLPFLLVGALAVGWGQRPAADPVAVSLAVGLVAGSTMVEVVGMAARQWLHWSGVDIAPELLYAVSSTLLAAAWLTVRGRRPVALLASPLAGVVSWFTIPTVDTALSDRIRDLFGVGTPAMFVLVVMAYALSALAISAATFAVAMWRRAQPTTELRTS